MNEDMNYNPVENTENDTTANEALMCETETPVYTVNEAAAPIANNRKKNKWPVKILSGLLIAALMFGSGYYGTVLASRNMSSAAAAPTEKPSTAIKKVSTSGSTLTGEQIADKVVPSVVAIITEQMTTNNFWYGSQVSGGAGSGVIINESGLILTNYHVVEGADTITVELYDGKSYKASVVGTYQSGDLAVIKIEADSLTPVTFADSDKVEQGATVYAVGNPEGNFSGSITSGIISATDREITVQSSSQSQSYGGFGSIFGSNGTAASSINLKVLQFDAAVSPGNSGGGLFNDAGELIGIVCAKSSDTDAEGLGFAIPSTKASEVASALIEKGTYEAEDEPNSTASGSTQTNTNKAVLGVTVAYFDEQTAASYNLTSPGVYICSVTEKSTSEAGIKAGDRLISVDDVAVAKSEDVTEYLADKKPGDKVQLVVERSGKTINCEVTLVENNAN